MERILEYFPDLTQEQIHLYEAMRPLYEEWNARINVISRKDMDNFYEHHVLHSLAIAKMITFPEGCTVLDVGTGGGFPGIPLAIMFPKCRFTLCDSIGKKIKVAQAVTDALGLENVECANCRAEELGREFNFVVSRAVTSLDQFYPWISSIYRNAVLYLKGGDLSEEIGKCASKCRIDPARFFQADISTFFGEEFFETKKIVIITK